MELASLETVCRRSRIYIALCMNRLKALHLHKLATVDNTACRFCEAEEISQLQLTLYEALGVRADQACAEI